MAIAAVGGAKNNSASAVTTLTATYSPTAGNIVVLFMSFGSNVSALVVKDNLGNTLTAGPVVGATMGSFWQINVPSGVTGYTATWTGSAQGSIVLEEYSGAAGVGLTATAGASGTTSSVSLTIEQPNNWVVAVCGSNNVMTASVGTQRQQTTGSLGLATLLDNTSGSVGSVTCSCTQTSIGWGAIAVELGGPGKARLDQDVALVIKKPTSANARIDQDLALVVKRPTSAKARIIQDIALVVSRNGVAPTVGNRVNQDLVLLLHKNPTGGIFQPNICVCT